MTFRKDNLVLFLLMLNVIVSITSSNLSEGGLHTGLIRAAIMAGIIPLLMFNGVRLTRAGFLMLVCLGYLLLLVPFSSSPLRSLDMVVKVGISLLMFILAYNFLRGPEARRKLSYLIPICLGLFLINFIAAQVFGLGHSYYVEEGIRTGGGGVHQTYIIAYLVLCLPLMGFFRGSPFRFCWWEVLLLLLALFPLVLIGRRGAILGFAAGAVLYLVFTPRKGRLAGFAAAGAALAFLTSPLYIGHVTGMLEHRTQEMESIENVGRVQELYLGVDMLSTHGVKHALFGSELFNFTALSGETRPLHTDYATYLIGAGLVGFLLYFGVLAALVSDFARRLPLIANRHVRREFTAVLAALMAAYLIISFSGQYYVISSLSVVFVLFGAIFAYMEEEGA